MQRTSIFYLNLIFLSLLLFNNSILLGQSIVASHISEDIQLDGILDEEVWNQTQIASNFWQFFPNDSLRSNYSTEIKIIYNDNTLFIGIKAISPDNNFVVSTLKRDFGGTTNDNVSLLFDTFNDGTNAYFFGVTPYGVQREGLVSNGGDDFNNTWDVKWRAESHRYEDYYTVEIAIPFTSLKFVEGATKWRFRPYRWNLQTNEQSTWVRVPQSQILSSLAFMGELIFEKPLSKSRTPIALIPYVNTLSQKDFNTNEADTDFKIGGDAKIAIGNGMNLDLTLNPDFSNVEVDDIFTNLTRFEVLLPEKRQFFVDNSDLFSSFGTFFTGARPFFSRRIGLARDTTGNLIQNNIIAGARLSGKLNEDWRLGFLNLQTAADPNNEIASNNNMMFALQRKVGHRSNVGVFMVNRQATGNSDFLIEGEKYNRVIGVDYNLATNDNVWTGRFYAHKSFQPNDSKGNFSSQFAWKYNKNDWFIGGELDYVNEDFQADLGFVPRKDIFKYGTLARRYLYPKNRAILNRYSFSFLIVNFWKPSKDFKSTDNLLRGSWAADFTNQSVLTLDFTREYVFLFNDFEPTRIDNAVPIAGKKGYSFNYFDVSYQSSPTQLFTYSFTSSLGTFYNGKKYSSSAKVGFRIQPWVQFGLALNYDGLRLPEPHSDADLWLLTPRFDVTFSKSLFWTTLIQYSNQRENFGINSRFQWRFAPLSDLYLVYNDNYYSQDFSPRFRSINLKVTYWLNL